MENFIQFGTELVAMMARALVDQPDLVKVDVKVGEHTVVFQLQVGPGDLGYVLGKQGSNIAAMRKIICGFAVKSKRRAVLEVEDSAGSQRFPKKVAA